MEEAELAENGGLIEDFGELSHEKRIARWSRPELADAQKYPSSSLGTISGAAFYSFIMTSMLVAPLAFQWMDIDMASGHPLLHNPDGSGKVIGPQEGPVPIIRLYGCTADGYSVLATVHGVTPYFYVSLPANIDLHSEHVLTQIRVALEQRVRMLFLNLFVLKSSF